MKITQGTIVAEEGEHVVMLGPIQGTVTLPDGEVVNVSAPAVVARDDKHAAEIAHAVGQRYSDEGHPDSPVTDENPEGFVYDDAHHRAALKGDS